MNTPTRHSPRRDAVLACLRATDTHPTADWIYDTLCARQADISRATVYRNLAQLRAQGSVISVATVDGFERFDGNTAPHPHFLCTHCRRVLDVKDMPFPQSLLEQAAQQLDAQIESGWITLFGVCSECKNEIINGG